MCIPKSKLKFLLKIGAIGVVTTLPFSGMVSCNHHSFDFTWSGNIGEFLQTYTQYEDAEISLDETLSTYLLHQDSTAMFEQDLAYCVCNNSNLLATNITFKLDMQKIDLDSQRFSFYGIVQENVENNETKNIYEMQVSNLKYVPVIDSASSGHNTLGFVPGHVSISNRTIIVDHDLFGKGDALFEILVNDYVVNKSYVFSYRQHDLQDQQEFELTFVNFFVFSPFFYKNTIINIK